MDLILKNWHALAEPSATSLFEELARVAHAGGVDASGIQRLRTRWDAGVVAAGIECVLARRAAQGRLHDADRWIGDRTGTMMASSTLVARHKAARFRDATMRTEATGNSVIKDLCCGIGADSVELANSGLAVHAFDLNPVRAWMASINATTLAAPICTYALDVTSDAALAIAPGAMFHLDPQRRDAMHARSQSFADASPGPDFLDRLLRTSPNGCVKLAPGQDFSTLPPGEFEVISERGTLTQGLLWTGALASAEYALLGASHPAYANGSNRVVRATLLESACNDHTNNATTISGTPTPATVLARAELGEFVFAIDPAPERVQLIPQLAQQTVLGCWHPALGLLTGDAPVASPWLTAFRICASMPWNQRRVTRWFREHDAGIIEVKTRDRLVEPSALQKALRGRGQTPYTLFVLRYDRAEMAVIAQRVSDLRTQPDE